jgi:tetratricopeptide (TPR) repeat protein
MIITGSTSPDRHIWESVGPWVVTVEVRRGAGGVCWATCTECACRRGLSFRRWADKYSQALGMHEIALVCVLALEGHNSPDVAKSYNNIALIYDSQGNYEEALEIYTKSLDIKTRIYGGDNHLDVAASYNNIGTVYESLGKYEEALEMHSKSLDIKTRILGGNNHPDVSASFINIGTVYARKGELENALVQFQKGLEIQTRLIT